MQAGWSGAQAGMWTWSAGLSGRQGRPGIRNLQVPREDMSQEHMYLSLPGVRSWGMAAWPWPHRSLILRGAQTHEGKEPSFPDRTDFLCLSLGKSPAFRGLSSVTSKVWY